MNKHTEIKAPPMILAPAGSKASFLAAIAAGADAVYCGMKNFSARMEAANFSVQELIPLTRLAHNRGVKVFVAINSLLKPDDLDKAGQVVDQLNRSVKVDGLIIQDLAIATIARQTGFKGELHLSTLANVSFAGALKMVRQHLDINRVVVPRELNIDEIKAMAAACPKGLGLEVFVHGALCYGISGRCYWSSYMGGKSGLRGRCVQPCRRIYNQKGKVERSFSCLDLSIDVLAKVLLSIPEIRVWKIEGRKKGPHYVYYTVSAYRMLRDRGKDPQMKKAAIQLLSRALGRPGTHYNFLPQRPANPICLDRHTGSGLLMGRVKGSKQKPYLMPREEILPGDILRIGYEDEKWHTTCRAGKFIPKKGRFYLTSSSKTGLAAGTPVFLTDRQEKALADMLTELENDLKKTGNTGLQVEPSTFRTRYVKKHRKQIKSMEVSVNRAFGKRKISELTGCWLSNTVVKRLPGGPGSASKPWWWLPPVIWPENEKSYSDLINFILEKGARHFVLNAPWQASLFPAKKKNELMGRAVLQHHQFIGCNVPGIHGFFRSNCQP